MAPMPHCKKCHGTAVYKDQDPMTGLVSIGCVHCGNRWPGGEGFYMADDNPKQEAPTMKEKRTASGHKIAPCDNCGRVLPIMGNGLCGGCRGVWKRYPEGQERDKALAEAKIRFTDPDYQRYGGKKPQAPAAPSADPVGATPTAAKREAFRQAADHLRRRLTPSAPKTIQSDPPVHPDLMFIRIHIEPTDEALIDDFVKICRRERRTMEGQILAMIDEVVAIDRRLDEPAFPEASHG